MNNSNMTGFGKITEVVHLTRSKIATVPWSEVEPLLNQIRLSTNSSILEVLNSIGYDSSSSVAKWAKEGKCPLRVKYALIGMGAELKLKTEAPPSPKQFSQDEIINLFAAVRGLEVSQVARQQLLIKLLKEIEL